MRNLHGLLLAGLLMLSMLPKTAFADEGAVRSATQALVNAWNRHDVAAWSAFLSEDAWYTDIDDKYESFKGRNQAIGRLSYSIESSDLEWEIVRMKTRADGVVSVVLVQRISILPKTDGRYKSVYTSDPSIARWRRDVDGQWRVIFFTSHKGWALAEIKKDDEGVPAVSATPVPVIATPPRARTVTRGEPPEFTATWGRWLHSCSFCHGRPPALPSSEIASRIVAVGAATVDGATLRAAMQRTGLGGTMDALLADPALTDAALEAVRRYLVDVRDGNAPEEVTFDGAGATRDLDLRNERSMRDQPAVVETLTVSGPFIIDKRRSSCRVGLRLAGLRECKLVLRATDVARPEDRGALEIRFASSQGLAPQSRRTVLRVGAQRQ